jgi:hypothetical protein
MAAIKLDRSVGYNGSGTSLGAKPNTHSESDIISTAIGIGSESLPLRHEPLIHFAAYRAAFKARSKYLDSAPVSNLATDIYFSHIERDFARGTGAFHQRFTS